MASRWIDNAFFSNAEQTEITAIRELTDGNNVSSSSVVHISKLAPDGSVNADWNDIISKLSFSTIDANTKARRARKEEEARVKRQQEIEHQKAKSLEALFQAKLEAFEIEHVKNSQNRALKSRLRRSKNLTEVNIFAMLIVKEMLDNADGSAALGAETTD